MRGREFGAAAGTRTYIGATARQLPIWCGFSQAKGVASHDIAKTGDPEAQSMSLTLLFDNRSVIEQYRLQILPLINA